MTAADDRAGVTALPALATLEALERELDAEEAAITAAMVDLRVRQRAARDKLDAARLALRPTYPTDEQHAGIAEALRRIAAGAVPSTHHGDGTPTYAVVVDGARGWLNIRSGAPFSAHHTGNHLWKFTDDEVQAFIDILTEAGHPGGEWWGGWEWISMQIIPGATTWERMK